MGKKRSKTRHSENGKDQAKPPVVLGVELAAALAAEERHKAEGSRASSPLPAEQYDPESNELGLIRPRLGKLDTAIAKLTRKFAKASESQRAAIRDSLSLDQFYALVEFSGRAAVFALRDRSPEWLTSGVKAAAMIAAERIDWRDITR